MALMIKLPGVSLNELPLLATTMVASSAKPSEIECEVVRLFEQFRDPVLRYVLSSGLSVQDEEEVLGVSLGSVSISLTVRSHV